MKAPAQLLVAASLLVACSETPTVIPTKNLDRPTDMGFACLGILMDADGRPVTDSEGRLLLSGQPMNVCHPPNAVDPPVVTNGQRTLGTFAFVPNTGRGELAVGDLDSGRLLDLGPLSPGYGMLPIGGDADRIAASQDGCWIATANRTTCDFALIDPARLLAGAFSNSSSTVSPTTCAGTLPADCAAEPLRRLVVRTNAGPLRTAVGDIAFLPNAAPGTSCQAQARPRAVATFPGCDLVALLDLSFADATATITSA